MKKTYKRKRKIRINKFKFARFIICSILFFIILYWSISTLTNNILQEVDKQEIIVANLKTNVDDDIIDENTYVEEEKIEEEIDYVNKPAHLNDKYYEWMIEISENEDVPLEVILAIVTTENESYNVNATFNNTNGTVDMGLCQINSAYVDYFAKTYNIDNLDPYNVYDSVTFVARHMKYLCDYGINKYGLNEMEGYIFAAGAYNRGLSNECKYRNMYHYKEKFLNNYNNLYKGE